MTLQLSFRPSLPFLPGVLLGVRLRDWGQDFFHRWLVSYEDVEAHFLYGLDGRIVGDDDYLSFDWAGLSCYSLRLGGRLQV